MKTARVVAEQLSCSSYHDLNRLIQFPLFSECCSRKLLFLLSRKKSAQLSFHSETRLTQQLPQLHWLWPRRRQQLQLRVAFAARVAFGSFPRLSEQQIAVLNRLLPHWFASASSAEAA